MKYLTILFVMFSSGALADDCKPIAEALAKQANASFRVIFKGTEWEKNGQCRSFGGLSRHIAGELSYSPYEQAADAFPNVSACRALGVTTVIRADFGSRATTRTAAEHFYATIESNAAEKLISEFWISHETGLVLKRSESWPDKTTVIEYEYNNLNGIF